MLDLNYIKDLKIRNNVDFADIFFENSITRAIVFEDKKIDKIMSGSDCGRGIRLIKEKEIDYNFSTESSPKNDEGNDALEAKIAMLQAADSEARSQSPKVKQVTATYLEKIQKVEIANSNGTAAFDTRIKSRFIINVIAEDNGIMQTGFETYGGSFKFSHLEDASYNLNHIKTLAKKAAQRALLMLSAKHAPSGRFPVVIMSEAGGTLIHEACGHGLEADFIAKKTSVYAGKIGQKVASELITVIDDPTIYKNYGSYKFDDEGTPSQKNVLIEKGILKGYMSDYYYSNILGISSSGNGRRESYLTKPQPRMTNTYIERGQIDPSEIINSIKNGLLVKKLGGGQVNVTNGDFVFGVQESYVIENGKIKEPVRGAMLIGNGPKILNEIDMLGTDLHFITGTCGKGDHAPVTDAMPTIRIPEIVVGGRN